ncbi:MAG: hypothetical protein M0Z96_03415 [Actinomycetota bacterium]|nr:hypothetical protein [Actinomycetota bacterium]
MDLVIVGDEFYGRRAAGQLGLPYRSMSSIGETDRYMAVVCTADEREQLCATLSGREEVAVIVCSQDCRPLVQLAEKAGLVFAGIPRKDQLQAAVNNSKWREEHMAAERSKIATARSIENLVSQHNDGGLG